MSVTSALILYPSWAIAVLLAATAVRLGRSTGRGVLALCLVLALWITALVMLEIPATRELSERVIPFGMLLAGAFVHATDDVTGSRGRAKLLGYAWGGAIGLLGAIAPRLLYTSGLEAPGPVFWPIMAVSTAGAILVLSWMLREATRQRGRARTQMLAIVAGNLLGISAGGGAILLRVIGAVPDLRFTAPLLLVAVLMIGAAVLGGEHGRARRMVRQALVYAIITAALSAVGLTALFALLPDLLPVGTRGLSWTTLIVFLAALPLDPVRLLVVESIGRRLYRDPIGVRDLADAAARSEVRADHAERLAEIGAITSAVAHEIRNPIGVIAAQAKVLERAGAPVSSVAALRDQVERARRFVDDLLRYGQPRPMELREVDVRAAIETAVESVQHTMPEGVVQIAIASPGSAGARSNAAGVVQIAIASPGSAGARSNAAGVVQIAIASPGSAGARSNAAGVVQIAIASPGSAGARSNAAGVVQIAIASPGSAGARSNAAGVVQIAIASPGSAGARSNAAGVVQIAIASPGSAGARSNAAGVVQIAIASPGSAGARSNAAGVVQIAIASPGSAGARSNAAGVVQIVIDTPAQLRVEADRAALVDVLIALVQNAAIAAGDRPGAQVRVVGRREADAIVILVEDDGPGVPAALDGRLFEPFVTGRGRDHRHPGTGLGLAIARRTVVRHGGTLEHERPAQGGARLVIRLPRAG